MTTFFKIGQKYQPLSQEHFLPMLNLEGDRISIQQLEYEMDRTDYPVDYNFLKDGIVVTLTSLTQIFNLSKPVI